MGRNYTKWAVQEELGWKEFEDVCTSYLFCEHGYRHIRQAGRVADQGRDAVVLLHDHQERVVFAFSKEQSPLSGKSAKFFRDYDRWRGSEIERFVFVSSQDLGAGKIDIPKGLEDPPAFIYDITDLVRFLDLTQEGHEVRRQHGFNLGDGLRDSSRSDEDEIPRPEVRFTVISLEDVSHAAAKRYTANILVPPLGSRARVRPIVVEAVAEFRSAEVFRNDITKRYWAGHPTNAVSLFVYQSLDDVPHANWICRCQWLSPQLTGSARPLPLRGDDAIDGIAIDWNEHYQARAAFTKAHTVSHATYLARMDAVLAKLQPLMAEVLGLHERYQRRELDTDTYTNKMREFEPKVTDVYRQSGDIGYAPASFEDLSKTFQQLMAAAHNVVLPFSERGLLTWPQRNRDHLVRSAVEQYLEEVKEVCAHRQRVN